MNVENLHEYQRKTVDFIVEKNFCGVFLEMGLGKTVSSLTAIDRLAYQDLEIDKTLVIGPKRVIESVWESEAQKWDHLKHLKFSKVTGNEKERISALKKSADVYLVSRDNIAWLCGYYGGNLPFDMLIVDELSSFKNNSSVRFRALKKARKSFKRIIGLTGTPSPNSLLDLWSQMYIIDGGLSLGKYFDSYREQYFKGTGYAAGKVVSYEVVDEVSHEIHDRLKGTCISMQAKDYLNLPKRIDNVVRIDMHPKILKAYRDFEKEKVLELMELLGESEEIAAVNAAALVNKLLQFANGAIYDEYKVAHEVHKEKIEALTDIVSEACGHPVLVAYTYKHDRDRILSNFKKHEIRDIATDKDIQDWNDGLIEIGLLHPQSGGHGLNLQDGGNIIVWFGNTWSLELEQQFNARLHRQGQKRPVIINKLVCVGTMDEDVILAQERKATGQQSLMDAVKARIDQYLKK